MQIPDYQEVMLPLLKFLGDEKEHSVHDAIDYISKFFNLTEEDQSVLLPSGQQPTIDNRVGWARTYMKKAGLLDAPKRSYMQITKRGLDILKENPAEINVMFLEKFPEFIEFRNAKRYEFKQNKVQLKPEQKTPQELLEDGYQQIRFNLTQDLLQQVKRCSPPFFEKLVVDLLLKMGYGGSLKDAGKAIGKSGDGGIDGIIKEDKLGLDLIYIQAKRWDSTVGRPEIHKFVGALQGQRARKGVFITTSNFSKEALGYVQTIDIKVILIDGDQLVQFMIDNEIGVSKTFTYDIMKIDSDYFIEE